MTNVTGKYIWNILYCAPSEDKELEFVELIRPVEVIRNCSIRDRQRKTNESSSNVQPFDLHFMMSRRKFLCDEERKMDAQSSAGLSNCDRSHLPLPSRPILRGRILQASSAPTDDAGTQPTLAVTIGLLVAGAIIGILLYIYRRKLPSPRRLLFWRKQQDVEPVEAFMENYQYSLGPKRYKYSELKKMTNRFTDKLGEGGYGGVFQGKLPDGRLVAVKLLKESKGNGEEFINEVNSIGRTAHVNIVSLVGFCFQGSKRALVYEFMPNGSLEKFIYGEKPDHLGWRKLYEIALGIARGLDYLHRGCTIRILHFDIKPHNILLDQDFCPKISDFGLAKLSSRKDSVISMGAARGTLGYIAPELLYGRVSYKSDVYSYGMMVLEMVGGRKNFDNRAENTSQLYFPSWIYSRLEEQRDLELEGIVTEEDEKIARKMIIVGLWCTQMDPASRPSMDKVLGMLEGSGEAMQIPPRPPLSSPARSFDSPSSTEETYTDSRSLIRSKKLSEGQSYTETE